MDSSELTSIAINRKARRILHVAMHLNHTYEACAKETVSTIQLAQFQSNPKVHGPRMGAVQLDLTSSTRHSNWNQAVVKLLAETAKSTYPGVSAEVDWRRLFTARIDRIISDATRSRKVGMPYDETKRKKVLKLALHRTLQRRFQTACTMLDYCTSSGDEDGVLFWSYILQSLNIPGTTGVSDEETVSDKASISFRIIKDSNSHHPAFRILFQYVDDLPLLYQDLFEQRGRKLKHPRRFPVSNAAKTHIASLHHLAFQEEHGQCSGSGGDTCPSRFVY
ncbi:hypothetical protein C8J55DRAFT_566603 [Lentinula edodes]|uniref:Uncharacterized protein n=1 Tax=Lentinula lateritia TaxID=40482 RepID=A0A9W8ZRH0_9AGAR|nr:hypothetical protein C8J55DRAFT_566603 [Lentinula edodes]